MISQRLKECLAMLMIGDGVLAMVEPRRHVRLWERGPNWWTAMAEPFEERPNLTRFLGAGEVAFGVWLALRQSRSYSDR